MVAPNYALFVPEWSDPGTSEVIVTANIMGGTLVASGNNEGDLAYRSRHIAEATGALVLAYERRGTGKSVFDLGARRAVQPDRYMTHVADTGAALQSIIERETGISAVALVGASSAGLESILLAQSETMDVQRAGFFDPVGRRATGFMEGFREWARYQSSIESHKPEEARNHNPMDPLPQPYGLMAGASAAVRTPLEMIRYGNAWRHESCPAVTGLQALITEERYAHIGLLGIFPEHTFTVQSTTEGLHQVNGLQSAAEASMRPAEAKFELWLDTFHSWTDDPVNLSKLARLTLDLRTTNGDS